MNNSTNIIICFGCGCKLKYSEEFCSICKTKNPYFDPTTVVPAEEPKEQKKEEVHKEPEIPDVEKEHPQPEPIIDDNEEEYYVVPEEAAVKSEIPESLMLRTTVLIIEGKDLEAIILLCDELNIKSEEAKAKIKEIKESLPEHVFKKEEPVKEESKKEEPEPTPNPAPSNDNTPAIADKIAALSPELDRRLRQLIRDGRSAYAVQTLRQETGMMIMEAKEVVAKLPSYPPKPIAPAPKQQTKPEPKAEPQLYRNPYAYNEANENTRVHADVDPKNYLGLISFAISLVIFFLSCIPFSLYFTIPLASVSIVLSRVNIHFAKKAETKTPIAIIGEGLALFSILLSIIISIISMS